MRIDLAGAIVVTALFWVIAWAGVTTRNVRLFVVLALLSLAIIGGALGPGRIGLVIEVAAGISAAVVIIRPERFGLGSLDSIDYQANATLRTLASALEGAEPESNALRSLASLHSPPEFAATSLPPSSG